MPTRPGVFQCWLLVSAACLLLGAASGDLASLDAALERGAFGEAVRLAEALVVQAPDPATEQEALLRLSQAHQALGDYGAAVAALERAVASAEAAGDVARVASLRGALGSLYVALARPEDAERTLRQALADATTAGMPGTRAVVSNNLGNHHARQGAYAEAFAAYRTAADAARKLGDRPLSARAATNAARALSRAETDPRAPAWIDRARPEIETLSAGHDRDMLRIHLARTCLALQPSTAFPAAQRSRCAHELLTLAEASAAERRDPLAATYALGYLGELYAESGRHAEALELAQRALVAAGEADSQAARQRWHTLTARSQAALGKRDAALTEYAAAVETLEALRHSLPIGFGGAATSFRAEVEPVYLEYVDLLLERAAASKQPAADLARAQQTVEQLKAAELRDYFRDECVDSMLERKVAATAVSSRAAVIYPILLEDRLELLVSSGGESWRVAVAVERERLVSEIRRFRKLLPKRATREYLRPAQQLHAWLVAPLLPRLEAEQVDTLVFVPDGPLRTIPMAALHDGERHLVERFATAITPGLQLTDPRPLARQSSKVLLGGVSRSVEGYAPLPHVPEELAEIGALFESTLLLDDAFRASALESSLKREPFSVVHLATHAHFGAEARDSWVLTRDGELEIDKLADYVGMFEFREQPLDLLMLSACETASGDERAALGMSGIAVKAGARSAAGTLWRVDDEASGRLVAAFYQELALPERSRAEALRRAQVGLLTNRELPFQHPAYWAAFVLIGSWL